MQLSVASKFDKGNVNMRVDFGGCHVPLGHFELNEHLTSFVIEVVLELIDCF